MRPDCFHSHSIFQWTDAPRARWIPNREYIHSMLSATYPNLTTKSITDCIHLINGCPDFLQIKPEPTSLLKRAESPIMELLMPQIENCYIDHCQGSLYKINDVTAVTVYDASGPREALKHH